jgi:hypothetical protein
MSKREDDAKRRRAFAEGLLPVKYAGSRILPDGEAVEAHMVELDALARIAIGEHSAWDVLAAEALAGKCFDRGCAVADGDADACPGWCAVAIAGFEGWVMAS